MSKIEVTGFLIILSSGALKDSITVVSCLLLESKDFSGRLDDVDGVGSLGLLIFNIGIKALHLRGHISRRLGPHSNVDVVADDILSLGSSDSITKVLKKSDDLLTSGWRNGIHLNQVGECTDEWEEGRSLLHGSGADFQGHILKLIDLDERCRGRWETSQELDGLVTSLNGLGIIRLSLLIGSSFSFHHLLVVGDSCSERLSLCHIFFNLTIKVI